MTNRNSIYRYVSVAVFLIVFICVCPLHAKAQGLELSGGYSHVTGDFGLDGFNVGAAWFVAPRIAIASQYDGVWDTSRVGTFEFTSVGAIASQAHLQDFLIGPRVYFASHEVGHGHTLSPFAEAQFGVSHLRETIQEATLPSFTNSDSAFSWMLGGGVDYPINDHWSARGSLDLLRTHLNSDAQSRLRISLGVAYVFGAR